MTTRPDKFPRWATTLVANGPGSTLNVLEPDEAKKDIGWLAGEKPPRNWANWLQLKTHEWIEYLADIVDTSGNLANNFAQDPDTTTGLTYGFRSGIVMTSGSLVTVAAGTLAITDNTTTLVYLDLVDNTVKQTTGAAPSNILKLATLTTVAGEITAVVDSRSWAYNPAQLQMQGSNTRVYVDPSDNIIFNNAGIQSGYWADDGSFNLSKAGVQKIRWTAGAGSLDSVGDLFLNIDTNNDSAGAAFIWGKDREGDTGGTELMRLSEVGFLSITGSTDNLIYTATNDGSDTKSLALTGGGDLGNTRGGYLSTYGNEHATLPGRVNLEAGNVTGAKVFLSAPNATGTVQIDTAGGTRFSVESDGAVKMHTASAPIEWTTGSGVVQSVSGMYFNVETDGGATDGFSWATQRDGIAGGTELMFLENNGFLQLKGQTDNVIHTGTSDTSDTKSLYLTGAGSVGSSRGAYLATFGNEHATSAGDLALVTGDAANAELSLNANSSSGSISLLTAGVTRWIVGSSGSLLGDGTSNLISTNTSDTADTKSLFLSGGGIALDSRGAWAGLYGNEHATSPGRLTMTAGNVSGASTYIHSPASDGNIYLQTAGATRWTLDSDGYLQGSSSNEAVISSPNHIIMNIDSDNNTTTGEFRWSKDDTGVSGTRLMTLNESGFLGINKTDPDAYVHAYSTTSNQMKVDGPAGVSRAIRFDSDNSLRWILSADSTPESGGDAGSNLGIARYSDTQVFLGTPLSINRSTGLVTIPDLNVTTTFDPPSTLAWNSTNSVLQTVANMDFIIDSDNNFAGNRFRWAHNGSGFGNGTDLMRLEDTGYLSLTGVTQPLIHTGTTDTSDTNALTVSGGGGFGTTRGGFITVYGNEHAINPGKLDLISGNVAGSYVNISAEHSTGYVNFQVGGSDQARFLSSGVLEINGATADNVIRTGTSDGADTNSLLIAGGGSPSTTRGAYLNLCGNEHSIYPSRLRLIPGLGGIVSVEGQTDNYITTGTNDTADTNSLGLCGGGAVGNTRGGYAVVYGNEHGVLPGRVNIEAGNIAGGKVFLSAPSLSGSIQFNTAGNNWMNILATGNVQFPFGSALSWESGSSGTLAAQADMIFNIDSNNDGTGNVFLWGTNRTGNTGGTELMRLSDNGYLTLPASTDNVIDTGTSDGSDTKSIYLTGAGSVGSTRGAYFAAFGNEHGSAPGRLVAVAGNVTNSYVEINSPASNGQIKLITAGTEWVNLNASGALAVNPSAVSGGGLKVGATASASLVSRIGNIGQIHAGYCSSDGATTNITTGMTLTRQSLGVYRLTHNISSIDRQNFSINVTAEDNGSNGLLVEVVTVSSASSYIEYRIIDASESTLELEDANHWVDFKILA